MARSNENASNFGWGITVLEWEISIPEGSFEFEPVAAEPLHFPVFGKILQVLDGFFSLCNIAWLIAADDPRKVVHSIKVGIGLALVSLFYFVNPLFESSGEMAVWAIMTVVVIFEFSAGATLSKGLNRMVATLLGGLLAIVVDYVARGAGFTLEPYIIATAVFLFSATSTFVRMCPKIKARYDYGFMIFILTFSFIAVSGYREESLFNYAFRRLETILIGCGICILTSLLISPFWAGEDLHKLIIRNLEGLARSLEGCVAEYFKKSAHDEIDNAKVSGGDTENISKGYKCVLNSKASEEALANFARWEFPVHGRFGFRHPWNQYVTIGASIRYCAYCVEALNGCLQSEIQAPYFLREQVKAPCMNIVAESSKIILALGDSIKTMTRCTRIDLMTNVLNRRVEELQSCLSSQPDLFTNSKSLKIPEGTPQQKIINFQTTQPSESKNPQVLTMKKADVEANKKPCVSSKSKNWPLKDIHVTISDSAAAGIKQVKNNGRIQSVALMETLPLATVACLLIEIAARLQTLITAVDDLGELANFKIPVEDKPADDNHFTQ